MVTSEFLRRLVGTQSTKRFIAAVTAGMTEINRNLGRYGIRRLLCRSTHWYEVRYSGRNGRNRNGIYKSGENKMHGRQELQRERARQYVRWSARPPHTSRMHARRPDTCRRGHVPPRAFNSSPPFPRCHMRQTVPSSRSRHRRPDSLKAGHAGASDSEQESIGDRQQQHAHGHGHGGGERPPADPPSSATLLL